MSFQQIRGPLVNGRIKNCYLKRDGFFHFIFDNKIYCYSIFDGRKIEYIIEDKYYYELSSNYNLVLSLGKDSIRLCDLSFQSISRLLYFEKVAEFYGLPSISVHSVQLVSDSVIIGINGVGILLLDLSLCLMKHKKEEQLLLFDKNFALNYTHKNIACNDDLSIIVSLTSGIQDSYHIVSWKDKKEFRELNIFCDKGEVSFFQIFQKYIIFMIDNDIFIYDVYVNFGNQVSQLSHSNVKNEQIYLTKEKIFILSGGFIKSYVINSSLFEIVETFNFPYQNSKMCKIHPGICFSSDENVLFFARSSYDDIEFIEYDRMPCLENNKLQFTKWWVRNNPDQQKDLLGAIMEFLIQEQNFLKPGNLCSVKARHRSKLINVPSILYQKNDDTWSVIALPITGKGNPFAGKLYEGIRISEITKVNEYLINETDEERVLRKQAQNYARSIDPDLISKVKNCCRNKILDDICCSRALRMREMSIYRAALLLEDVAKIDKFDREVFFKEESDSDSESGSESDCDLNLEKNFDLISIPSF